MSIMDFFASQGTASPSPDSERGDWIDWYLNREGPAGRFRGSRRPRYGIDYLFNGGGSVRSQGGSPRGSQRRTSSPAPTPAPTWDTEREYNKFQTRANEPGARLAEQWAFDMNRANDKWPWTLDVTRTGQPRGQHKTQGRWNVKSSNFEDIPPTLWARNEVQDQDLNNTGIMNAVTDYSPDARGRWLTESPKGNKLLSFLVNKFGSEGSSEYLEDILGSGGISAFGGTLSPTWGDNGWGLTGTWEL